MLLHHLLRDLAFALVSVALHLTLLQPFDLNNDEKIKNVSASKSRKSLKPASLK